MFRLLILVLSLSILFTQPVWAGIDFDDVDDFILIKDGIILAQLTNSSISAWFNTTTLSAAAGYTIYSERASSGSDIWKFDYADTTNTDEEIFFTHRDDSNSLTQIRTGTNLSDGDWHHVGLTKSGTAIIIYVDGAESTTGTLNGNDTLTNSNMQVRIGSDQGGVASDWSEQISEVAIWNVVLTANEMLILSDAQVRRMPCQIQPSGLLNYWPMDEVSDGASGDGVTFRSFCGSDNEDGVGDDGANNTGLTGKSEEVLSYP